MKYFDRNRVIAAIVVSIVVHAGIFAFINFKLFSIQEQEFGPVYIELSELPAVDPTSEPTPESTPDGPEDTPEPADTPEPVDTSEPEDTPEPIDTPEEIDTPEPVDTPDEIIPENTATPTPENTKVNTPTPLPTPKPTREVRPTPRPTPKPQPSNTPKPIPSDTPQPVAPTKTATPKATNTPKPTPTSMFENWEALQNVLNATPVPTTANTPAPNSTSNGGTGTNNSENSDSTTTTDGGIVIEWADATEGRRALKEVKPEIPEGVAVGVPLLKVTISFKLLSSGILTDLKVVSSSGYSEIDTAAIEALRQWQFEPIASDITVTGKIPYVITQN